MSSHHSGSSYGSARSPAAAAAAGQPGAPVDAYTAEMRDRQARGKDPYESSDASTDWSDDGAKYRQPGSKDEPFSVLERRRVAAQVLDSPELLMMAAQRDNESIPATRLRYTRMLCGLKEPPSSMSARKKAQRGAGGSSSRVLGGSITPGRSSRKEAR
ncbi:hypothetical protein F5Y04DRAFT_245685 [Hypomontagnella monticulosa]|nr:hypothetical protein F5Y04DRAFT_245685 [Hypomontagnella monticulosa]